MDKTWSLDEAKKYLLPAPGLQDLFVFRKSSNTGGKAGKGMNISTSFMLASEILFAGSYFSYRRDDPKSLERAILRAERWKRRLLKKRGRCEICGISGCGDQGHKS